MTLSHWRLPGIVGSALSALLIGLLAIAVFGPLLNMLIWTVTEAWYFPAKLPVRWGFAFWDKVFRPEAGAMRALGTSLLIAGLTVALSLAVAIPAGYALSRYRFIGRSSSRRFLLVTQMLSPIVLVLGIFRLLVIFGVLNDVNVVAVLYAGFNIAFSVWMLESYFSTIPRDLEEAAWIEGASRLKTLVKVFLPLALPAIAVTALFTFVNSWNEFVIALTMLRREGDFTLPIQILSIVSGRYAVEWHLVMAAAFCATLPVAVAFAWMQKFMLRGLTAGAVK